jgi:DNA-binding PadR family transcriptional regulator
VEKKGRRRRCYYTLTREGQKTLVRQLEAWKAFSAMVNELIGVGHA